MAVSIAFLRRSRSTRGHRDMAHRARGMLKLIHGVKRARVDWTWTSDERAFPLQLRTLTIGMRMTLL
jgi:hypothetical protein